MSYGYDYAPQEIRNLPFNSKRSQLYPVNPETAMQAVEDAIAGRRAVEYLPKKMAFTRYKNGPAAQPAASSAVSMYEASQVFRKKVDHLTTPIETGKGIYTTTMASNDFVRLPQPFDNWYANPDPIAKGLLDRPVANAAELDAFSRQNADPTKGGFYETTPVVMQRPIDAAIPWDSTPLGHVGKGAKRMAKMKRTLNGLGKTTSLGALGDGSTWQTVYGVASIAGTGMGAYHGYKRNNSVGWAIGWGLLGGLFPIIVIPLAFAQGFGKRA